MEHQPPLEQELREAAAALKRAQAELEFLADTVPLILWTARPDGGLDYYNKTVFEFSSENLGAQNAFCGGGRYDQLIGQIGGKEDQPSVGAAMGIERLMLLLEQNMDKISLPQKPALQVVMPFSKDQHMLALLLADELHAQNITVETLLEGDSIKSMMKKANKLGAAHAIMLGEDEQKNKTVAVKNMITGEQVVLAQTELVNYLKK